MVQPWTILKINGCADVDPAIAATLTTRWLSQIDPAIRHGLLEAASLRNFVDGEMIYGFEQKQTCLWGVVSGAVRLFVAMSEQDPRLAHCAGPGFWFGAAPVITGGTRTLRAMASGSVRLCSIDRSVVVKMAERNPEVWRSVAVLSIINEGTAIGAAEDLMMRAPRKRLVATLLRMAGWRHGFQGVPPMTAVPMTQLELAESSSLSRSSAAAIMKDLAARGLIRTDYRSIAILDADALTGLLSA
jgi:CRP/FNR family transcriptional regulator, cyclic AMP receptor protein